MFDFKMRPESEVNFVKFPNISTLSLHTRASPKGVRSAPRGGVLHASPNIKTLRPYKKTPSIT